ncbi:MAG: WYL domain-containing protein [Sideroxydans sp.]|nr:WYL domain-containing protein [Sideroxydans sp.]
MYARRSDAARSCATRSAFLSGVPLYLVCRYKDFDNERSLALHRIINAQASTFTFERPKNFDLEQYDNDGRFGFGNGKRIKLTLHISQAAGFHLLESPLSIDQQVQTVKDGYEITATVVDTAMLDWWLRGFGDALHSVKKAQLSEEKP